MEEYVLRTHNLTKRYGDKVVVDNVNISIKKGDIYGLIGRNGAGKTTFIRMITDLTCATSGSLELFGKKDGKGLVEERKRIGGIIETPVLYNGLTAKQNLEYYRIFSGIADKNIIEKLLDTVGLEDTGKKKVKDFSLGMKQRLGLALAILGNPDFIILDEPINGLDPIGIVEMRNIIKRLNTEFEITVLISSHILPELSQIATKYGIINDGKLVKEVTKQQLDEECVRSLLVEVDDVHKATIVMESSLNTTNYVVVDNHKIRLYDYLDNPSEVTYQLNNQGVRVSSISEFGIDLENYFINVIGEVK